MPQMKKYEADLNQEFKAMWRKIQDADSETSHLTDKELGLLDKYQDLKPCLFLLRKDKEQECLNKIWQKIKPRNVV